MYYIWNLQEDELGNIDPHCIRQFDDYDEAFVFYLVLGGNESNGTIRLLDEEENFEFIQELSSDDNENYR
jgi:hypothetical protein